MQESPFATYREILVDGTYSAAGFLQSFALAMYAGAAFPMDASGLRNLDDKHMRAFQEMAVWFRRHGESDPDFVEVCQAIKGTRAAYARRIKQHLDEVLASDPECYDGGPHEHASSVQFYRREHAVNQERGWIE